MKKMGLILLSVLFMAVLASCTTFSARGLSSYTPKDYEVLGQFEESVTVNRFVGSPGGASLFNILEDAPGDAADKLIRKEIQKLGGSGAINIEIKYEAVFWNMLVNSITGGLWAPAKLTISGTVIR